MRDRDWNNDIVLYNRTLELSPDAYLIQNNLGSVYWHGGARDKAESLWRAVLARNPNESRALNNMGLVAGRKKQYAEAADFFERSIKINPHAAEPHSNLGATYRLMGMLGPAERELRIALALSPVNYQVLNELGQLLFGEGRVREAEEQFRASVRNCPSTTAYDYLGTLHLLQGAMPEAQRDFQAALALDVSDSKAHFGLGDVYQAAGRGTEALSQYQAGLVRDPTNARALEAVHALRRQDAGAAP
jgi:tetratricopeptide (TPR) repeat protein